MIKKSATAVLLLLIAFSVSAQKKNTLKNNNVKSVTEYKLDVEKSNAPKEKESYTLYDKEGNVLEEIEYDNSGKVKTHMKYQYDTSNNKIKETELAPDGKTVKSTEYKYKGDLKIEKNVYDAGGKLKSKKIYQYDFQN